MLRVVALMDEFKEKKTRRAYVDEAKRVMRHAQEHIELKERLMRINRMFNLVQTIKKESEESILARVSIRADLGESPEKRKELVEDFLHRCKVRKVKRRTIRHVLEEHLFIATAQGNVDEVKFVLEREKLLSESKESKIVNKRNPIHAYGTPYHVALESGNMEISKMLYVEGSNPFLVDAESLLPVNYAMISCNIEAIERFVEEGY